MAKKYRAYRIREDPKTRYRYVTEILNIEEARELVNKKWSMILICQKSIIKDPSEDFKIILDEGERKMLQKFDDEDEEAKGTDNE
jgi:sugar-specific transcriptional regulator TrmB